MGKINGCLKCLFIFFNVIFAIFGFVMVYGLVKIGAYSDQLSAVGSPNMAWAWVLALGVLGTSCLGIFAGCSEKPRVLKIFAGFMGVGMIVMMICGIVMTVGRNKMRNVFQDPEVGKVFTQHSPMKEMLDHLQPAARCCGLTGASDWGTEIPPSCACSSAGDGFYAPAGYGLNAPGCKAKPQGLRGPNTIYEQPCSNYLVSVTDMVFNIALGTCFGFAVVALLGLLISLLMMHQIKCHDNPGASFDMKGF